MTNAMNRTRHMSRAQVW